MSRWPLTERMLFDLRMQIFWYGLGLALYVATSVWLFPLVVEAFAGFQLPESLGAFFGQSDFNIANPAVYLQTRVFSFLPLILSVYAVVGGTGLLAADEGRGSLELVLAQPVSRTRLTLERFTALAAGAVLIVLVACLGWLISAPFVDLQGQSIVSLVVATWWALPVAAAYASLSLLLASLAPARGSASGILTAVVITGYLLPGLAGVASGAEWLQYLSLHYYSDSTEILSRGIVGWHQALLLAIAAVALGLALSAINGREIGIARWQWRAILGRPGSPV